MTLCWTETDVDAQRVNFARGETERGRSDLSRVPVSRFAFLFRDFRSRAYTPRYTMLDFLRYTRYFEIPEVKIYPTDRCEIPINCRVEIFSPEILIAIYIRDICVLLPYFEMHAIAENL